ncbi:MAG TPA: MotA/TolQ/ExbB proton channel family protein [Gemmatimonadaceae bacterium]|nr:MotA/TolQ/ExbB proton channel family protein [Gemmatimonadaceae bacterium]
MRHTNCTPHFRPPAPRGERPLTPANHATMRMSVTWYSESGPIMLLLAVVGLLGLILLIERVYVIVVRSKHSGRQAIERTIQLVRSGKVDEAIKLCAASTAAIPDIGLLILRSRTQAQGELQIVADAAALFVLPKLTRRLSYLRTLSAVAIMLGLIGALGGIHAGLLLHGAGADPTWATVAHASDPFALGLAIAIVLTLGHGYLASQAEGITDDVREFSARLVNALTDRPDVRLGHR